MPSSQKLQILLKPNCTWMFIGWSSTNFTFFVFPNEIKMAAMAGLSLTLDPMGKMFKNLLVRNHLDNWIVNCRNDHWKVLYKTCESFADRKFKMAAMTRLSLTLDPMGISHFHLFFWNHKTDLNQTWQKCSLDGHIQDFCFWRWSEIQHGCQGP